MDGLKVGSARIWPDTIGFTGFYNCDTSGPELADLNIGPELDRFDLATFCEVADTGVLQPNVCEP